MLLLQLKQIQLTHTYIHTHTPFTSTFHMEKNHLFVVPLVSFLFFCCVYDYPSFMSLDFFVFNSFISVKSLSIFSSFITFMYRPFGSFSCFYFSSSYHFSFSFNSPWFLAFLSLFLSNTHTVTPLPSFISCTCPPILNYFF